jgi:NADH-quinone oxidoreductase subunit A
VEFSLADVAAGYLPILLFLGVALALSGAFVVLPMLVARLTGAHQPNAEKLSEYECGFPAFEDSRARFDVRFYLVAILFIVFDLEAAFLFPWAVSLAGTADVVLAEPGARLGFSGPRAAAALGGTARVDTAEEAKAAGFVDTIVERQHVKARLLALLDVLVHP